jgi:fermentation-respiration switch protein FrsA (DUF1100 family)
MLVLLLFGYLGIVLVLVLLEDHFLFHPIRAEEGWWPPPDGLDVQDVQLSSSEGDRLHAWWTAPTGWTPADGALLYCHGNAGNLSHRGPGIQRLSSLLRVGVLIFDYPGYGHSTGKPSEPGCYAAADAGNSWLTDVRKVPAERILLYGRSLGCAVAAEMALRHPNRAMILVSPFTSVRDMAAEILPWLPGRWLASNRFNTLSKIGRCSRPVLIAHGTADQVIPFNQGKRLFAAAKEPKYFVEMPGLDHNDAPNAAFYATLQSFLAEQAP